MRRTIIFNLFISVFLFSLSSCALFKPDEIAQVQTEPEKLEKAKSVRKKTKKALKKSIVWHKESAAQGFAEAEYSLGNLLQAIVGNTQYSKESIKSFKEAAKMGHAGAQNSLAMHYFLGNGVIRDIPQALYWFEESGKNGNIHAIHNLGRIYAKGQAVKTDNLQAYKWLDLARFYTIYSNDMRLKNSVRTELEELQKVMSEQDVSSAKNQAKQWLDEIQTNSNKKTSTYTAVVKGSS